MGCTPVPREQVEIVQSLNGWVAENMLLLLNPMESSWQPHDFLSCSAVTPGALEEDALSAFMEGVAALRAGAADVPDEVLVCLVARW
jgi:acyl-[acyl-carrier-protein] desaturase